MSAKTTRDEHEEAGAEHQTLTLTSRGWEAFLAALDGAHRPRPHLATAVRRYQSRRHSTHASTASA